MVLTRAQLVKNIILEMIKTNKICGNKLPTEDELAKLLQVSLATLREALLELNKEGIISKRHGLGNFIHKSTLETKMRIDRFSDFVDLLKDGGHSVTSTYSVLRLEKPDAAVAKDLQISIDSKIAVYDRTFYANGRAAIHAQNRIPYCYFVRERSEIESQFDLNSFIEEYCQQKLTHGIQEISPMVAGKFEEYLFGIMSGSAMISWKETFYTIEDKPICLGTVKFNPDIVKMKMLWK